LFHLEVHGVDAGMSHFADGKIREFKKWYWPMKLR
jgi:hypothetical protein